VRSPLVPGWKSLLRTETLRTLIKGGGSWSNRCVGIVADRAGAPYCVTAKGFAAPARDPAFRAARGDAPRTSDRACRAGAWRYGVSPRARDGDRRQCGSRLRLRAAGRGAMDGRQARADNAITATVVAPEIDGSVFAWPAATAPPRKSQRKPPASIVHFFIIQCPT